MKVEVYSGKQTLGRVRYGSFFGYGGNFYILTGDTDINGKQRAVDTEDGSVRYLDSDKLVTTYPDARIIAGREG